MNDNIKAILFDFGGTIDTDGVHWFEKFWELYQANEAAITRDEFREAYLYAEPYMPEKVEQSFGLLDTLNAQVELQVEYLVKADLISKSESDFLTDEITQQACSSVQRVVESNIRILEKLYGKYKLGLVSNYYGNIKNVLIDLSIDKYFSTIIDSSVVGIKKPDKKIFALALDKLKTKGDECIVVGDSYDRDIIPAKQNGCKTVLLLKRSWYKPEDTSQADYIIDSFAELLKMGVFNI